MNISFERMQQLAGLKPTSVLTCETTTKEWARDAAAKHLQALEKDLQELDYWRKRPNASMYQRDYRSWDELVKRVEQARRNLEYAEMYCR